MTGCVSSRVTAKSSELRVESLESVEKVDSIVVESSDTVREVTTITIVLRQAQEPDEAPDTLKISTVTDRTTVRDRSQLRVKSEKLKVETDTVYIEKDSLVVKEIPHQVRNEGGGLFGGGTTGRQGLIAGLTRNLRWLFFVLVAVIALILLIRLLPKR